jgi:type II secretory ATPase GspE/PulE/Tfp pilus assembly ATPase PilB-like protein
MGRTVQPVILCIDDDRDLLRLMEGLLTASGYRVVTADNGPKALAILEKTDPDLIILDVMMPEMDGYEVCNRLQRNKESSHIPIVFVTALGEDRDKAKAFKAGAVDYVVKPIKKDAFLQKVKTHLVTKTRWQRLISGASTRDKNVNRPDFEQYQAFLSERLDLSAEKKNRLDRASFQELYELCPEIQVTSRQMANLVAEFLNLPYLALIDPEEVSLGVFPTVFCQANLLVPVGDEDSTHAFVLSNPFDWEVLDSLEKHVGSGKRPKLFVTEPGNIESLLEVHNAPWKPTRGKVDYAGGGKRSVKGKAGKLTRGEAEHPNVVKVADHLLHHAVAESASDIHIEPKKDQHVVRVRIDGDLRGIMELEPDAGNRLISRFKALGGLDIAERRKPQDGACETTIDRRTFKLRLATSSTPNGESLVIRLLEPGIKPKELDDLGMLSDQVRTMLKLSEKTQGLILIVGPTGSGKTTTIFSFLSNIDCKTRSLMSVEDPVEYRISFANQQQVNEKAGVTFESLLKSSVRQDPDILFIGEIRDLTSARIAMDFASTGHLTISTLHTSNATTAVFRLERLGIDRGTMADSVLCVIAQRLVKKLCSHCKKTVPISQEEREMLSLFNDDQVPSQVAHPVGCPRCNNTGYHGREGIYEVIEFDREISKMIRKGVPVSEIRTRIRERGDYMISDHAMQKVKDLTFSPSEVYSRVISEEIRVEGEKPRADQEEATEKCREDDGRRTILLVEDDQDTQKLIARLLETRGYRVKTAGDGVDALLHSGSHTFDLIISDINMPDLDGFKLLEILNQKGIDTPVVFLSGRTSYEDEIRGIQLGARDYIKKPIQREIFLARVENALTTSVARP